MYLKCICIHKRLPADKNRSRELDVLAAYLTMATMNG